MVKSYSDWLSEAGGTRDLQTPVSIELEAGKVKVYADPQAENWAGESIRVELYEDMLDLFKEALDEEDDTALTDLLKTARELPLFGQDQSQAWKQSQVDGVEQFRTGAEYRRWLAKYCIEKINAFIDWARNNK
jgi:hypothetical protein